MANRYFQINNKSGMCVVEKMFGIYEKTWKLSRTKAHIKFYFQSESTEQDI